MDLSHIREIAAGDKQFLKSLLQKLQEQIPEDLSALRDAIATRDYDLISQKAHKLKSPARMLYMDNLIIALEKLEHSSPADEPKLADRLNQAERILESLLSEIQDYLDTHF